MKPGRFLFLSLLVACGGAEESPLLDSGNGGGDGGGSDVITGNDVSPVDTGNCEPTCATIPQGFQPVRPSAANTACPSGWVTADGVTNPAASDSACTCTCNITQNPDCTTGKIFRAYDDTTSATCGTTATTLTANGTNCTLIGGTLFFSHFHYVADPPPPSGGTCQYDAQLDKGKLSGTPARLCVPPQTCQGAICDGGAICIAADGDQACPSGFPTKTLVGAEVTASCGACGACSPAGTCAGTVSLFTDQQCMFGQTDIAADAVCKQNTVSGASGFVAFTFKGALAKATCAGTPSSTATPALDKPVTVCCK